MPSLKILVFIYEVIFRILKHSALHCLNFNNLTEKLKCAVIIDFLSTILKKKRPKNYFYCYF